MIITNKIKSDNNHALVIDDWYTPEEYHYALQECKFVSSYFKDPFDSDSAMKDGKLLKSNKACFINRLFLNFNDSIIGRLSQKLYDDNVMEALMKEDWIFKYLALTNSHNCLVSYYEESDYYKSHIDSTVITMVTWLYEQPKAFEGGNLIIRDHNQNFIHEIECVANRSVIFPSIMHHEVTNISMDESNLGKLKGRFTISQFSNIS